jgi:hypothetical protein
MLTSRFPSSETIKALTGLSFPYSGVLKRGQNAVESFADALGFSWKSLPYPRALIIFDKLRQVFPSDKPKKLAILKGLPNNRGTILIFFGRSRDRLVSSVSQPNHVTSF